MNRDQAVRIVLVDDHAMFRAGVRSILEDRPGFSVVAEAGDGRAALDIVHQFRPDVVLMDMTMPELNGIDATRQLVAEEWDCHVVALSMHSDRQFVKAAFQAGARGYLLKNSPPEELIEAIQRVRRGQRYLSPSLSAAIGPIDLDEPDDAGANRITLSPREREVLQLLAEGHTNKEVAQKLGISAKTVEVHRAQIMDRLNIRTMAGLTKYAIRHRLTSLDD